MLTTKGNDKQIAIPLLSEEENLLVCPTAKLSSWLRNGNEKAWDQQAQEQLKPIPDLCLLRVSDNTFHCNNCLNHEHITELHAEPELPEFILVQCTALALREHGLTMFKMK